MDELEKRLTQGDDADNSVSDKRSITPKAGARNSSVGSVVGSLSCVMQRRGFDPPLSLRQT